MTTITHAFVPSYNHLMPPPLLGLHHMTAITGPPQRTLDFYRFVLGMRLVKVTVNYDDPGTYHIYFGDRAGLPGTLLTFFPQPNSRAGEPGAGQVTMTSLAVPPGSLSFWRTHLAGADIEPHDESRDGHDRIRFRDPDGLVLEVVEFPSASEGEPWRDSAVDGRCAIRSMTGMMLSVREPEISASFFRDTLGLIVSHVDDRCQRLRFTEDQSSPIVEIVRAESDHRGHFGQGTVHHIAFRVADEAAQEDWLETLRNAGLSVSGVRDRHYFRSIYFREPGGVIIEIATDHPGFTLDEPLESLGSALRLPPWLESQRSTIEESLAPIDRV